MKTIKNCAAYLSLSFLFLFAGSAGAQEAWYFKRVLHESYYDQNKRQYYKQPDYIQADIRGGMATFTVEYTQGCVERYEAKWSFNRDISVLRPGEEFWVTVSIKNLGDCTTTSVYGGANAGAYDGWSFMRNNKRFTAVNNIHGFTKKVFPYPYQANQAIDVGHTQGKFQVTKRITGDQTYFHIIFRDNGGAYSGQKDRAFYEIVYLYQKRHNNIGHPTPIGGTGSNDAYSSLAGLWYMNGNPAYQRYIYQNGNQLTFVGGQSSSKGYFAGQHAVYATDWRARGSISPDFQTIRWNNQTWTRYPSN